MLPAPLAEWFSRSIGYPFVINGGWRRDRDRRHFAPLVREKLAMQFWPAERWQAWQIESLKQLLEHAGRHVPYYRDLFREIGFQPGSLRSLDDLQALPPLSRQTMRAEGRRMLAESAISILNSSWTGGTTGMPLEFWRDRSFDLHFEASAWMSDMLAGRRYGSRTAYLWGAPRDNHPYLGWQGLARKWLRNEYMISSRVLSEADWEKIHRAQQAWPPDVLVAYASSVTHLAMFLERHALKHDYPRVAVIPTAEPLEPSMRAQIERVFKAPVYDRYGSREIGLAACECDRHTGMHINVSGIHLECAGPDPYQQPGEVLITQLHNFAMPLIRYEIGDLAVRQREPCPCGRTTPLLRSIVGRKLTTFVSTSGDYVESYNLISLVRRSRHLREFQLVQEAVGRLRLLVEPEPTCTPEQLVDLQADILQFMGPECELIVEAVEHIPRPPSGKRQMLVSLLQPEP